MTRTVGKTQLACALIVAALAAAAAATAAPATSTTAQGSAEQQLTKLERDWCQAAVNGDAATVGAILADDYTDVMLTGQLEGKVQALAHLTADKTTACNLDAMQIRVYGDTAVVVARTAWQSAAGYKQFRYTDVYVRRQGRWKCVASQNTEIKD